MQSRLVGKPLFQPKIAVVLRDVQLSGKYMAGICQTLVFLTVPNYSSFYQSGTKNGL